MKKFLLVLIAFVYCQLASSQVYYSSSDIFQKLKKLEVLGSVLYVAAHPDDENTRLLSYYSSEKLYRTGYLSVTRGDGGQNLIGDEQGVDLGLIRTQELLAARRIDGAEQFFTRAFDFGYSKNPEETLEKWNKEKILADMVWVIRKFQPDVIVTRFPVTGEGGHGHHTASAILANEAFTAAADARKFPEQLKYVEPWQAKRIAWNSFNWNNSRPPADAIGTEVGAFNSLIGKSYGEIASDSRSQHKSQGFGVARNRGEAMEYFKTTGGTQPKNDLFEDLNTGWSKVKGGTQVASLIKRAIDDYDFKAPHKSVAQLVNIYNALQKMEEGYWASQKMKEVVQLIEMASGIWLDAYTSQPTVATGDSVKLNVMLNNRSGIDVILDAIHLPGFSTTSDVVLKKNVNQVFQPTIFIDDDFPITQPYWLELPMDAGSFNVSDQNKIGQPDVDPALEVSFQLIIEGKPITIQKPLRYKYTDPVRGEVYQPFAVIPPFTIQTSGQAQVFKETGNMYQSFDYVTHRRMDSLVIYSGNNSIVKTGAIPKNYRGNYHAVFDIVSSQNEIAGPAIFDKKYSTSNSAKAYTYKQIEYDHIPSIRYFMPAKQDYIVMDLKTVGKKIGYITGAGDKVPEALMQMGYEVVLMGEKELSNNNLQQFDAIITGVRAYNTNEWLNNYHDKLMEYVKNGGNMIVQYNTSNQIGPVRAKIGPYNFNISRTRVSVESAPVFLLDPAHQVFIYPNKIVKEDFDGWVQERSVYHAGSFDAAFKPLIRMNDPGEKADDGSLITAQYGKGFFTYTGIVFFRQLPSGVPGAYKLMANLIGLNQKGK